MDRAQLRRSLVVLALGGFLALILLSRLPFCPMAGVLGIPCPGCGLTRATLAALHGDLRGAFHLHPLVFLLTPLFVWSIGAAALGYVRGPRAHAKPKLWFSSRSATLLASVLLVATLGVWGVRFFGYLGGPVPVATFRQWADSRRRIPPSTSPVRSLEPATSAQPRGASATGAAARSESDPLATSANPSATVNTLPPPTVRRVGRAAVVDNDHHTWQATCSIHKWCATPARSIPLCAKGKTARPWSDISRDADALAGTRVEISGRLEVAPFYLDTAFACAPNQCCHHVRLDIVLGGPPTILPLDPFACSGDDSRQCCDVFADERSVIAAGTLERRAFQTRLTPWQLSQATLCETTH